MADPISLGAMGTAAAGLFSGGGASSLVGAAGIGSSILGTLLGAKGEATSGQAQQEQLLFRAGLANINAKIAEQNANYAVDQGEMQAGKYGLEARARAGQIKAAQASSNLDVNTGSAKQVQESQHTVSQIDLNQIRTNANKVAWDYEAQANQFKAQSMMDTKAAGDVGKATGINIAQSFISGGASVASKWLAGRQQGLWGGDSSGGNTSGSLPAFSSPEMSPWGA